MNNPALRNSSCAFTWREKEGEKKAFCLKKVKHMTAFHSDVSQ